MQAILIGVAGGLAMLVAMACAYRALTGACPHCRARVCS